jgi:phospholipase/carboxylesterase
MMALHAGLALPPGETLMGVVGISGAFLPPEGFGTSALARPPVCLVHGDRDDVVSPVHSAEANDVLTREGFDVSYHVSRGVGHGVAPDGLDFIARFIEQVVK